MHTDAFELITLRISTWTYLIVLCLSMLIIVLFTCLNDQIHYGSVDDPSIADFEYLKEKYTKSTQCPCSEIAIPHYSFISLSPHFHPVCTSDFVSDLWFKSIADAGWPQHINKVEDVFISGHKYFKSLSSLCQLTKTTVLGALSIFNQSSLITDQTLSNAEFTAHTRHSFNQFVLNTAAEVKHSIALIQSQISITYTTGQSDAFWKLSSWRNHSHSMYFQAISKQFGNCSCALDDECKLSMILYNYTNYLDVNPLRPILNISNMFVGCFPIKAVFQSSLDCIFDQTCLNPLVNQMKNISEVARKLNISTLERNSTRFPPKTLIQEIINEIMIETWNEKIDYSKYYTYCAPKHCSYSYPSRNNAVYGFITMIGLFGGLSGTLRIIVPFLIHWIRNTKCARGQVNNMAARHRFLDLCRLVKKKAIELNVFESEVSWNDPHRRHREIISTRIYIFLLTFSVIILAIYTGISTRIQIVKVDSPSQSTFERLASDSKYSSSLDCPCKNISVPYSTFASISLRHHQVCSSDFVVHNSLWIKLIYCDSELIDYGYDDYRYFIIPHFRLLFFLCTLANDTFTNALSIFRSKTYISKQTEPFNIVNTQMRNALAQFQLSVPRTFLRRLDLIRDVAHGNGYVSRSSSNWYIEPVQTNNFGTMAPRSYGNKNCSCGINASCTSLATIDKWIVPGFLVGCYPLESLLQSTLECLYDLTCINRLKNITKFSNITFRPLDPTLSSHNVTVQSLVDVLMIDQWESNIIYENYYTACSAPSCTYVIIEQVNLVYMITTIFGLYGGLTIAFKVIVPILMTIVQYLIMHRRRRVEPVVDVIPYRE
ncbi:unnamed protein product [Adineta ricciae]|uniref:Uncharacterized protein n=1 Tax=Adineta ricciae TaxID=249248 RepID=A0A814HRS6_ADIRI|nr:unnamed protein product [Adineta ricciae]